MSSPNEDPRNIAIGNKVFKHDSDGDYLCASCTAGIATPYSVFIPNLETSSWNGAARKARRENKYVALARSDPLRDWAEVAMASDLTTVLAAAQLRNWEPQ